MPHLKITSVQQQVSESFGVPLEEMLSPSRKKGVIIPRQVAMFLSRELGTDSYPKIARAFGKQDHTTVMNACSRVSELMEKDLVLHDKVAALRETMKH